MSASEIRFTAPELEDAQIAEATSGAAMKMVWAREERGASSTLRTSRRPSMQRQSMFDVRRGLSGPSWART